MNEQIVKEHKLINELEYFIKADIYYGVSLPESGSYRITIKWAEIEL